MKCNGLVIGDLKRHQEQFVVNTGGTGGYGNIHFKSALNRRPLEFTKGEPGEEKTVELELKTIADVGLVREDFVKNCQKTLLFSNYTVANERDHMFRRIVHVHEFGEKRKFV